MVIDRRKINCNRLYNHFGTEKSELLQYVLMVTNSFSVTTKIFVLIEQIRHSSRQRKTSSIVGMIEQCQAVSATYQVEFVLIFGVSAPRLLESKSNNIRMDFEESIVDWVLQLQYKFDSNYA